MIAGKTLRCGFAVALTCLSLPVAAQDDVRWQQSPVIIMPGLATGAEATFREGTEVVVLPLRWASSARLAEEVSFRQGGEQVTLPAGSLLPQVRIGAGDFFQPGRFVFCTRRRLVVDEPPTRFGLLSALTGNLLESTMDGQNCLEDSDNDGSLDRALALGQGGDDLRDLGAIIPVSFQVMAGEPIGISDDKMLISLQSVRQGSVRFEFNLVQRGDRQIFDRYNMGSYVAERFIRVSFDENIGKTLHIMGLKLEILSSDHRADQAVIRWSTTVDVDETIVVPQEVRVSYSY